MRVSAVLLSFNSARYLETSVEALIGAFEGSAEPNEIWVVENGSKDGSADVLRALEAKHPGVVHGIYCEQNTGTTVSRNVALRRSTGRYLLIMDSDVIEVPDGTVEKLIEVLDADPACGIAVPRLLYPSGRFQISTDVFPTVMRKLQRFLALKSMECSADALAIPDKPTAVDYAISAFWLIRRNVYERIGGLDEQIFYSPEDVDYCLRVWEAGYKVVYEPSVYAVHDAQEISRGFKMKKFTWNHAQGLIYLFGKHGYALGHRRLYRRIHRFGHVPD